MLTNSPRILVVEDDQPTRDLIARYLSDQSCSVATASNGGEMDRCLAGRSLDLVVLDLMLPGEDGLSLCHRLRSDSTIPIIMLTAKGDDLDRILGLEMGADDYLPKPFNPRELRDPDGAQVALTSAEFDLLQAFCERPGRILTRDGLLSITRSRPASPFGRSIDVLISWLRRKLDSIDGPSVIRTVRTGGYIFTPHVEDA
jgi:two-component system, OmpR family, response regulator